MTSEKKRVRKSKGWENLTSKQANKQPNEQTNKRKKKTDFIEVRAKGQVNSNSMSDSNININNDTTTRKS
jgi:hypothetical protein